jgi:hypothetical protein
MIFATHFVNAENPTLTFQIRRVSGQPSKATRTGQQALTIEFQKTDIDFALDGDPVGLRRRFTTLSQNLVTLVEIHLDGFSPNRPLARKRGLRRSGLRETRRSAATSPPVPKGFLTRTPRFLFATRDLRAPRTSLEIGGLHVAEIAVLPGASLVT